MTGENFFASGRSGRGAEDKFFRVGQGRSQNPRGLSGKMSNRTGSGHFQDGAGRSGTGRGFLRAIVPRVYSEVEFVNAATAGGSVKFLSAV